MRSPIFAAALLLLGAPPAFAHAFLRSAEPPVGSTVSKAPQQVRITFTEGVEPRFSAIEVQDAVGKRVDKGSVQRAGDAALAVALGPVPPGTYKVTWHATATDTHKTEGSFSFTVAP